MMTTPVWRCQRLHGAQDTVSPPFMQESSRSLPGYRSVDDRRLQPRLYRGQSVSSAASAASARRRTVESIHDLAKTHPRIRSTGASRLPSRSSPCADLRPFADRMKFLGCFCGSRIVGVLVYAPIAQWVWVPGRLPDRRRRSRFLGGTVVHINSCGVVVGGGGGRRADGRRCVRGKLARLSSEPTGAAQSGAQRDRRLAPLVGWFGSTPISCFSANGMPALLMAVNSDRSPDGGFD